MYDWRWKVGDSRESIGIVGDDSGLDSRLVPEA
jgi:hypothetical protein